jgi:hypothetical protein
MKFVEDIRARVFGLGADQIETDYGPIARIAYEIGLSGRGPYGRYTKGGVMFAFALEGLRQYKLGANFSRRLENINTRRAKHGMA